MPFRWHKNEEIRIFQEYLHIRTVHPNVNYDRCVEFLRNQSNQLNLKFSIHHPSDRQKPVVVLTWYGTDPSLPSIILNSHMDVVPVFPEYWTHPPFGGEVDADGRIFGRGTQDMKSVGMQYLAAIRALKKNGSSLKRTIHIIYVPDEEIGGATGMMSFVKTDDFRNLNAGFSLDEGIAEPNDVYPVFYGERSVWRLHFKCSGTTGHGSLLLKNTAAEKLQYIINKFMEFRKVEVQKLENNPEFTIGDVTSVNLTILNGGVQSNVIPPLLTAVFDVRLAIDMDHGQFEIMINNWCKEAGGGIELIYETKKPKVKPTKLDESNIFWTAFKTVLVDEMQQKIRPQIFAGRTDSCFIRELGIPAIGFSPLNNTPVLLHDNDEYITVDTYLKGINIYRNLIEKLGNI